MRSWRRPSRAPARASRTSTLVAATRGPGLVGALLVGFCAAKGFAAARRLPFAAVDHLQGHIAAAYLAPARFEPPFLALIASGGHTLLLDVSARGEPVTVLARTLDDAAGEAFDKGARMLGLGYPGGAGALAAGRRRATRRASTSRPGAARTSPSPVSRRRCSTAPARSTPRTGRARRPRGLLPARDRRGAHAPRRARPAADGPQAAGPGRRGRCERRRCARGSADSASSCSCRRSRCAPTTRR